MLRNVCAAFSNIQIGLVLGILIVAAGCGQNGPERYDVSGSVTFAGKPVPAGQILFQPDTEKGNRGPATAVQIEGGRYDTAKGGKGTVGGPHIAVITGYDKQIESSPEMRTGRPLFRDVRLSVDLPKKTTVRDLNVSGLQ